MSLVLDAEVYVASLTIPHAFGYLEYPVVVDKASEAFLIAPRIHRLRVYHLPHGITGLIEYLGLSIVIGTAYDVASLPTDEEVGEEKCRTKFTVMRKSIALSYAVQVARMFHSDALHRYRVNLPDIYYALILHSPVKR